MANPTCCRWMCPAATSILIESDSVKLDDLLARLEGRADLTVAVFDACREIPEISRLTRSAGLGASGHRGLGRVRSTGRSRLIAYSGAAGQLVADGDGRNSPYTALLRQKYREW